MIECIRKNISWVEADVCTAVPYKTSSIFGMRFEQYYIDT